VGGSQAGLTLTTYHSGHHVLKDTQDTAALSPTSVLVITGQTLHSTQVRVLGSPYVALAQMHNYYHSVTGLSMSRGVICAELLHRVFILNSLRCVPPPERTSWG